MKDRAALTAAHRPPSSDNVEKINRKITLPGHRPLAVRNLRSGDHSIRIHGEGLGRGDPDPARMRKFGPEGRAGHAVVEVLRPLPRVVLIVLGNADPLLVADRRDKTRSRGGENDA